LNPEPWLLQGNNNQVEGYRQKLLDIFDFSFKRIEHFKQQYNQTLNLHWRNLNVDLNILYNKLLIAPVDCMNLQVLLLQKEAGEFEDVLVPHQDLGLFRVEASNLKKQIMPVHEQVRSSLNTILIEVLRERRNDIFNWLSRSVKELTCMVSKIEEFVQ